MLLEGRAASWEPAVDRSQRAAVFYPVDRSVLVVAPPGYGKTYVMTNRVSYLLQGGHVRPPARILGLTFTNAAAGEMLERVQQQVAHRQHDAVSIMTFHSFCYKALRAYGNYVGLDRDYDVIGSVQSEDILVALFTEAGVDVDQDWPQNTEEIRRYDQWQKERILGLNSDYQDPQFEELFESVYARYVQRLDADSSLDFTHILLRCHKLFMKFPQILELYRAAFSHLLVDEFHDTNPLQFKLLKLLALGHPEEEDKNPPRPVFVLADQHQAIYEFQGARPENVEIAEETFDCSRITLERNYRTDAENIVWLARGFWDDRSGAPAVELDDRIELLISDNPEQEAERIVGRIQGYEGPLHEVCVVAQSSYRLSSVRDLLSQADIDLPFVFVPDFRSKNIELNYAGVFEPLSGFAQSPIGRGRLAKKVREICAAFKDNWREDEVLNLLVDLATQYDYKVRDLSLSEKAQEFSNDLMLDINWGDLLRRNVRDKIFLSTIHGVKGLQFDQVHICGLSNFEHIHSSICFPCNWGRNRADYLGDLEEPFRTLYVAVTRARHELYLYTTKQDSDGKRRSPICLLDSLTPFLRVEGLRPEEGISELICGSRYMDGS